MLVKNLMSWPVITVFENSTVGEALDLLRQRNIRHLLVVDLNDNLSGVVTETDLLKVFPNGKSLSPFEFNLLARTPVSKVMKDEYIHVSPETVVEEAALLMRINRIGCLPVLDEQGKLVGLLAKNDIIDAFISALGLGEAGTRITVVYRKKWGFLAELIDFADNHSICIDNIVTFGQELVLKVRGKVPGFAKALQDAGYKITNVSFIDPPGQAKAE